MIVDGGLQKIDAKEKAKHRKLKKRGQAQKKSARQQQRSHALHG
jgi:hypothetical protein